MSDVTITDGAALLPVSFDPFYEHHQLSLVVAVNGTRYKATEVRYSENAHGATDTATIIIPLSSATDLTLDLFRGDITVAGGKGPASIVPPSTPGSSVAATDNSPVFAEIYAGFPQTPTVGSTNIAQLKRLFVGEVDKYSGKFDANTVTFTCRSLGAPLVDDRLVGVSGNQTMAQFLAQQAAKYGLPAPIVKLGAGAIPATINEILGYEQIGGANFAAALNGVHPSDLAIRGAQVDDTDVWLDITDGTIHYESPSSFVASRSIIELKYGRHWMALGVDHSPQFSKTVQVQLHSHQPRLKQSTTVRVENDEFGNVIVTPRSVYTTSDVFLGTNQTIANSTVTAPDGTQKSSTTFGSTTTSGGNYTAAAGQGARESAKQKYPLFVGNVSPARAQAMAKAYWRQISQHEFAIEGEVPVTSNLLANLSITSLIRLTGTPWSLVNDTYYPRSLEHAISVNEGWRVKISALNHRLASGAV